MSQRPRRPPRPVPSQTGASQPQMQPGKAPAASNVGSIGAQRRGRSRPILLTAAVSTITILGTLYGAKLKIDRDASKELQTQDSSSNEDTQVVNLNDTSYDLVSQQQRLQLRAKEQQRSEDMIRVLSARQARLVREREGLLTKIDELRNRKNAKNDDPQGPGSKRIWKIVEGRGSKEPEDRG